VVVRLTTRNTLLLTVDGNHVYLPNATVFKNKLTNYVRNPFRRFDFAVGVGVEEDLLAVFRTGVETLQAMPGVVDDPAPAVRIAALGDSSVVVEVFGWVDQRKHSFLAVRTEAIRRIKEAFDLAGYDMPEPIYRVSMRQMPEVAPKLPPVRQVEGTAVDLSAESDLARQAEQQRAHEDGEDLLVPPG
jgi:small-conductance mechanosensitive channel